MKEIPSSLNSDSARIQMIVIYLILLRYSWQQGSLNVSLKKIPFPTDLKWRRTSADEFVPINVVRALFTSSLVLVFL